MNVDHLDALSFQPGEFERLQSAFDRQCEALALRLQPILLPVCREQLVEWHRNLPPGLVAVEILEDAIHPDPVDPLLKDAAMEEADLLAGLVLHHWCCLLREHPDWVPPDVAARACTEGLYNAGWSEPVWRQAVQDALIACINEGSI